MKRGRARPRASSVSRTAISASTQSFTRASTIALSSPLWARWRHSAARDSTSIEKTASATQSSSEISAASLARSSAVGSIGRRAGQMRTSSREASDSVSSDQRTLQAPRGGGFGARRRLRRSVAASSPSESWVQAAQTHHEGVGGPPASIVSRGDRHSSPRQSTSRSKTAPSGAPTAGSSIGSSTEPCRAKKSRRARDSLVASGAMRIDWRRRPPA
mmetsp:Transcript_13134/g.40338  ORF Transcript_13134/g.40338 Transcript_13134/m.40338 type:complete len:216 (+) Transcript_13134:307-954(+)